VEGVDDGPVGVADAGLVVGVAIDELHLSDLSLEGLLEDRGVDAVDENDVGVILKGRNVGVAVD
jgi:hypothetical protein